METRRSLWLNISLTALAVLGLSCLLFRDFLFNGKVLLYKDFGADSVNIYYPYYVLFSNYLRHVGLPSWSFQIGMGQSLFPYVGTIFVMPVVWLPEQIIAPALIYQHLLYAIIAGVLFARFLASLGLTFRSTILGAILLSFSGYMCLGSCWHFHAAEVVCFAFLLLAAEQGVSRGKWLYLVMAVAIIGFLGAFHLYLCALFLSLYVPCRFVEKYPSQWLHLWRVCALLAAAAILGVGLTAIVTMDNFRALVNSPRGSGAIATKWAVPALFHLESASHYITAGLRAFSNDILGTGNDFHGWGNYLEAPILYCGLFCLFMLPQVFIAATRRQRVLYSGFLCFMIFPIVFPWFRYLFWLFQGGYYRTFSLFSIFGVITLSMTAFSRYVEGRGVNLWVLGATLLALLGFLYLPVDQIQSFIDPTLRQTSAIFLMGYGGLLATGQLLKRQGIAAWIILALSAVELIHFDRITVSNQPNVTKQELKQRVGYNDQTVDAVRDLRANDKSFFRIRKTWPSSPSIYDSLNDSMVFGFYGTSSYSSFNNLNYIKFLMAVAAISGPDLATETQWSRGLMWHPLLSTFACEKYVLTKSPVLFETADYYELVRSYGDIYLFRNQLFLPLGLTFRDYVSEDMFRQLPSDWAKPLALLHSVVLSNKDATDELGLAPLSTQEIKRKMIETPLPDIVSERRRTALNIRSFSQTRIEGTVRVNGKSILVLQTPFDPGWHAFVDGHPASTLRVDAGLLGVPLSEGGHTVELRFRPPLLYAGATVTMLSCCIFFWSFWKWPRIRLPSSLE